MVEAGGWRWSGRKKARANQGPDPLTGSACQACFGRLRAGGRPTWRRSGCCHYPALVRYFHY